MIEQNEIEYSFQAKKKNLLGDKTFTVDVYQQCLSIWNDKNKFVVQLQLQNVLYWELQNNCERAFGFRHDNSFVYLYAPEEQLSLLRNVISGRISFFQQENYYHEKLTLGKGSTSQVILVERSKDKTLFAMKIIDNDLLKIKHESYICRRLVGEPGIIQFKEVIKRSNTQYGLVMEYFDGQPMSELLKSLKDGQLKLTERQKAKLFSMILRAVYRIHLRGIIHRDLKPDNVLISKDLQQIRIIDFGLGVIDRTPMSTLCGTPGYISPEILLQKERIWTTKTDMFSLGIILYKLLNNGRSCFLGENTEEKLLTNASAKIDMTQLKCSKAAYDLINALTSQSPLDRLSSREALSHPFLTPMPQTQEQISTCTDLDQEPYGEVHAQVSRATSPNNFLVKRQASCKSIKYPPKK